MNAIKNLTDVLSNSLTTTLNVEYQGYMRYVQMLKQLERMSPLEFTYYDDLNVPRVLKVPPITLVPLTMLHIKRASFDYSVAVDEVETFSKNGELSEPELAMEKARNDALKMCKYVEYKATSAGQYKQSGIGTKPVIQVGVLNTDKVKSLYQRLGAVRAATPKQALTERDLSMKILAEPAVLRRKMVDAELSRLISNLKSYNQKPFVLMDGVFYFPMIMDRSSTNTVQTAYTFDGFTLNRKGASLPAGRELKFCPVSGTAFQTLGAQIEKCVQYTFYQDGSAVSSSVEKLVPVPSTAGLSPIFSVSFSDGGFDLLCEANVYYVPEVERRVLSQAINVKSEKRNNSNLRVTVKMGQAGISQGVISLLNSKNRTNLK